MDNFVALDFETANFAQSSVCSVGMVIVKNGEIAEEICNHYSLSSIEPDTIRQNKIEIDK